MFAVYFEQALRHVEWPFGPFMTFVSGSEGSLGYLSCLYFNYEGSALNEAIVLLRLLMMVAYSLRKSTSGALHPWSRRFAALLLDMGSVTTRSCNSLAFFQHRMFLMGH